MKKLRFTLFKRSWSIPLWTTPFLLGTFLVLFACCAFFGSAVMIGSLQGLGIFPTSTPDRAVAIRPTNTAIVATETFTPEPGDTLTEVPTSSTPSSSGRATPRSAPTHRT